MIKEKPPTLIAIAACLLTVFLHCDKDSQTRRSLFTSSSVPI